MGRPELPVVSHPLLKGVQTNVDSQALPAPALAKAENVVFLPRGSHSKRPGCEEKTKSATGQFSAGTFAGFTLDSARSLFAAKDELVVVDKDGVSVSWAASTSRWYAPPSPASLVAPTIRLTSAQKDGTNFVFCDVAEAAGWRLTVWQTVSGSNGCKLQIQDVTTGAIVVYPVAYGTNAQHPSALAVGGVLFALYINTSANELRAVRIVPGGVPSLSGDQLITTVTSPYLYDTDVNVAGTLAVAFVHVNTGTDIARAVTFNSAGTIVTAATAITSATGGAFEGVCCAFEPNTDRIGFAWIRNGVPNRTLRGAVFSSVLVSILAETTIDSAYSAQAPNLQPTCVWEAAIFSGAYRLHVLYSAGSTLNLNLQRHAAFNDAGTVLSTGTWRTGIFLASRAFRDGPYLYVVVIKTSITRVQDKFVVMQFGGGTPTGRNAWEQKYGGTPTAQNGIYGEPVAVWSDGDAVLTSGLVALAHVQQIATRHFLIGVGRQGEALFAALSLAGGDGPDRLAWHVEINFAASALRALDVNGITYLTAGQLMEYDRAPVEGTFLAFPDPIFIDITQGTGGSLTLLATYSYVFRYAWTSTRGVRHVSQWIPLSLTLTGSNNRVTFQLPTLPFSSRQAIRAVSIEGFRSKANPLVAEPDRWRITAEDPANSSGSNRYVANDPLSVTVQFVDDRSDSSIDDHELLDQSELDPFSVGHCTCAATDGNRLWIGGLDDPNVVWPSMLVSGFGDGVKFNPGLQIRVDDYGGDVVALAVLNEQVIVFKRRAIYVVAGEGPDNAGNFAAGRFSTPQLIQSDVGCTQQSTMAVTPLGVVFMSAKGFCLINQSLQVQYIGGPVEIYNSETFVAATVLPKQRQIRFLSDSAPSLMYDYELDVWSTFTGTHFGVAGAIYLDSQYVYAKADGTVRFEDASFRDGTTGEYGMLWETAWLRGASLQAYLQSGSQLAVLGKYYSPHKLRLTVFYDYDDSAGTAIPDFTPAGIGPVEQVRFPLPRHHAFQSIKFRLEEISLGSPLLAQSFSLVEMALELAEAGGIVRLPVERSA